MVQRASMAIAAGKADSVLCIGAGKFPKVSTGGAEAMDKMVSHAQYKFIYGSFIPALYALVATRHMAEFGTTSEHFAQVAVSARKWALKHPDAFMRANISNEGIENQDHEHKRHNHNLQYSSLPRAN